VTHTAYPTAAALDHEARAGEIAMKAWNNNQIILDILRLARDKIEAQCDLNGYSLIPGFDLRDVLAHLDAVMPDLHGDAANEALDAWAHEQVEGE
jgi:hypothetical protein